ncbi:two-component sensor histidine kinase [Gracilibacillus boraciitolerans JCM 21714]|uniref:histidine kinase n=1 Tax=Gracilibacillus boraciitolerans JCM 21714 TaxID=1298598 RepID=W4VPS9_9BACI|nr:ATP-binding protein [Gracilibacillus boraciitolerans]GAE95370.1 two-component sensor histidine kinase [Gracilibacillus boraciitolerans JCM 21714]
MKGNGAGWFIEGSLGIIPYLIHVGLLFVALYCFKKDKPHLIKYIYFIVYILVVLINDVMIYLSSNDINYNYQSGNIIEVLLVLFSPIFVNKTYFWIVSLGMVFKYTFIGSVTGKMEIVMTPILLVIIMAMVAYLLLTRVISYITAIKKAYEELQETERLATVGEMAAGITHEIRNPLTSIKGLLELKQMDEDPSDKYTPIILDEVNRIDTIVNDLMMLGKPKSHSFSRENVPHILEYVVSLLKPLAVKNNIKLKTKIAEDLQPIYCDEIQIKQVFINLVKNAIESMENGGEITIAANLSNDNVVIEVIDQGVGIPQEKIPKMGEPFYTTKETGTGLGLMVSIKIIEEHQGDVLIDSEVDRGTSVTVILPINGSYRKNGMVI